MIEKEVCLNNSIATVAEKQDVLLQVDVLYEYQRIILGVLLAIAGLSLCVNFCVCLYCFRRRQTNRRNYELPTKQDEKGQKEQKEQKEQKDAIYVL